MQPIRQEIKLTYDGFKGLFQWFLSKCVTTEIELKVSWGFPVLNKSAPDSNVSISFLEEDIITCQQSQLWTGSWLWSWKYMVQFQSWMPDGFSGPTPSCRKKMYIFSPKHHHLSSHSTASFNRKMYIFLLGDAVKEDGVSAKIKINLSINQAKVQHGPAPGSPESCSRFTRVLHQVQRRLLSC